MEKLFLNGDWRLNFIHGETQNPCSIIAKVPGNVELDLERAEIIGDALPVDQEFSYRWLEFTDWEFEKEFEFSGLPENSNSAILNFDGIDTAADIFLNGEKILYCENMHIAHSCDVTNLLKIGVNKLQVKIYAPEFVARKYKHTAFPFSQRMDSLYLRKARHMWGWDNAPRRLSGGIWKSVYIEFLAPIRFESVYVATDWIDYEKDVAYMTCHYIFETPDRDLSKYDITVSMVRNGKEEMSFTRDVRHTNGIFTLNRFTLKNPALWNPIGFGEPNLYDCVLTLRKDGKVVAENIERVGVRMIHLDRSEITDMDGNGEFQFYCNGQKIYMRGTNWKPLSPYHSQTPEKMQKALNLLLESNCNMVRVWGGGIYEDHEFFDFCDEHGIFVWQDFMLACEWPPNDDFFCQKMYEEAIFIIKKYRNHPSLALWCGDNENDAFWASRTGRTIKTSDCKVTREIFARAVKEYDPWREYVPSSPYISDLRVDRSKTQHNPNLLQYAPEQHLYCSNLAEIGVRKFMEKTAAHFSSEIGPIGVCAMSETPEFIELELPRLKRLWNVEPDTLPIPNDMIHQSDRYCANWCKIAKILTKKMFGRDFSPENPMELCQAINFYVADYFKYVIELWRVQKFRRTGMLLWSLLDMWHMGFNYSVVDSNFRKKFPFEVIKLSQQPLALMVEEPKELDDLPKLHVVNDTAYLQKGEYKLTDDKGKILFSGEFEIETNGRKLICEFPLKRKETCFIEWNCGEYSGKNYYINYDESYDFEYCQKLMDKIREL